QLMTETPGSPYCGIGFLFTPPNPSFEATAFDVVERICVSPNYSSEHEMGHNMGLNHDRATDGCASGYCGAGAASYAFGYRDPGFFRTIMAYACSSPGCPRILHFSNPNVAYAGRPTGIDPGAPTAADNALALNDTRVAVSNFRQSVVGVPTVAI